MSCIVIKIFQGIGEIREIRGQIVKPDNEKVILGGVVKKSGFWAACQEYILDNKAPDTRFVQCLQGFRVITKLPTMGCTLSAFCAKIFE
jgi:hypothetical protein